MLTNIYLYVETKSKNGWKNVSDSKGPKHLYYVTGDPQFDKNSWYNGRSYNLFALLAGRGNSDIIAPIKEPIGIPSDVSNKVRKAFEKMGDEVHTPSSYTLKELLDKKDITFNVKAVLDADLYKKYKKGQLPESWYTLQHVPRECVVTNEKMDRLMRMMMFSDDEQFFTEVSIDYPYNKVHTHFWDKIIPAMENLKKNPEDVRIVFWFEN